MSTQAIDQLQRMTPRTYFFGEHRASFNEVFDPMAFDPTAKGFIDKAEWFSERALKQGIALHPFDTAMFLIDWWRSKEMEA